MNEVEAGGVLVVVARGGFVSAVVVVVVAGMDLSPRGAAVLRCKEKNDCDDDSAGLQLLTR